jgi:anti-sigma factor RsiW
MKTNIDDLLLRALDGVLTADEARRIEDEPALRARLAEMRHVRHSLREGVAAGAETALRPFFVDRLMRRIAYAKPSPEEVFVGLLDRLFRRVALAGLIVVAGLTAYNFATDTYYETQRSVVEVALALPPVSVDVAYEFEFASAP